MKERPITFTGPMVKAILGGRKTQTRRVVKNLDLVAVDFAGTIGFEDEYGDFNQASIACPYGRLKDQLWVREALRCVRLESDFTAYDVDGLQFPMRWRWKHAYLASRFMPKEASRITLEITAIRVERLQEISLADIQAEGIPDDRATGNAPEQLAKYRTLWDSINGRAKKITTDTHKPITILNGPHCWESNPWVWVIEFKALAMAGVRRP